MSAWSFKKQFVPKIVDGSKTTTIRALRVDGRDPLPGSVQRIYTGMRTKGCLLVGSCEILTRDKICIIADARQVQIKAVLTDGMAQLNSSQIAELSLKDGFESVAAFWKFFSTGLTGYLYHFELVSP